MQVQLNLTFDLETAAGRKMFQQLQGILPEPRAILAEPEAPRTPSPGRQEAAANARAAKVAKQQARGPVSGPVDDDVAGPSGNGDGEQVEDLGLLDDPSMSPGEAREAGLALVREAYAAGKVAQVKALQKAWGIAKFYDIPVEKGHEFYAQVMKLALQTGIRK
jgi:hypothetical protein